MSLTIDASTPAPKQANITGIASSTCQSNSFTPPASSLLAVFNINAHTNTGVSSIASSAGGLSFTKLGSASTGTSSYADCWVADVGTSPGAITLTSTYAASVSNGKDLVLAVLVLNGAAVVASQTGSIKAGSSVNFNTGVTLSSAAGSSWIFASAADWEAADTPTFPAGQTDTFNSIAQQNVDTTDGDSKWVEGNTAVGNSNLTINTTTPNVSSIHNSMFGVEIVAGAAAAPAFTSRPVVWPQAMWRSAYR